MLTKSFLTAFVVLILSFGVNSAYARERVATSVVGGRVVVLYDDLTWAFEGDEPISSSECEAISRAFDLCGMPASWNKIMDWPDPFVDLPIAVDDAHLVFFIAEEVGSSVGLVYDNVRQTIINNVANASGVSADQIPVLDFSRLIVNETDAEQVIYSANMDGVDIVYINTTIIRDNDMIQAIVYTFGREPSDGLRYLSEQVLDLIVFK